MRTYKAKSTGINIDGQKLYDLTETVSVDSIMGDEVKSAISKTQYDSIKSIQVEKKSGSNVKLGDLQEEQKRLESELANVNAKISAITQEESQIKEAEISVK